MISAEMRALFRIHILMNDLESATRLKYRLTEEKFEALLVPDAEVLLDRLKKDPPHLIVFSPSSLTIPLDDFVHKILKQNSEVLFLPVAHSKDFDLMYRYRDINFIGFVSQGVTAFEHASWLINQAIEKLTFTYQNEQLIDKLELLTKESARIKVEVQELKDKPAIQNNFFLAEELARFKQLKSMDDLVQRYFERLADQLDDLHAIFFKYLPELQSFLAVNSYGIPLLRLKGVGFPLDGINVNELPQRLPAKFLELMNEGFGQAKFACSPVWVKGKIDGLTVLWQPSKVLQKEAYSNHEALFAMLYERSQLLKSSEKVDEKDATTGFYSKDIYWQALSNEVARSRRLLKPTSLVKIQIDNKAEVLKSFGPQGLELVLKTIAELIQRTSRPYDWVCRTGENEVALILAHCARKGAAIRAERLRRVVETHSFSSTGLRVTLSCGISEYPTLASTPEELNQTASEALGFISGKGGNKVCLFKPQANFQPLFEVPPL